MLNNQFCMKFTPYIFVLGTLCVGIAVWTFTPKLRAGSAVFGSRVPKSSKTSSNLKVPDRLSPSLLGAHDRYVKAFVDSDGFGESRLPRMDNPFRKPIDIAGRQYHFRRLELVSLQVHDVPVAYVNHFSNPVRSRYKQGETRSLTEFERQSLESLRSGHEFVFNGDDRNPRCVGAIRAQEKCLECHDAQVGDLLGAFSYELHEFKTVGGPPAALRRMGPM